MLQCLCLTAKQNGMPAHPCITDVAPAKGWQRHGALRAYASERPGRELAILRRGSNSRAFLFVPQRYADIKNGAKRTLLRCGGATRNRTGDEGFADLCLTAWLWRQFWSGRRGSNPPPPPWQGGALPNELLPQWCLRVDLNHRHRDFQSLALPTELPRQLWRPGGGSNP